MNAQQQHETPEHIPVPVVFFSSDSGKPFDHCLVCNKFLLETGTEYIVEKAVKQHPEVKVTEVIFEYAMCMDCAAMMNASMSEESRERLAMYFNRHANLPARRQQFVEENEFSVDPWVSNCVIKNTPVSESSEYQLVAHCNGKHMLFTLMPFAISFEAMEEMSALLSDKTLGEIDDFTGKYFTGPPEVAAILKKRLIFV